MTDEVKQALQVLRDNATSDFERHRIDVLERDLTNPPQVEVIDDKHQRFNGISFCKRPQSGYYYMPNLSIYRTVWTYYHGELPEGYAIHHIDSNKDNNSPSNLIALTHEEHAQLHGRKSRKIKPPKPPTPPKQPRTRTCPICGKTFEMKPRDSSNKGRKTCSAECEQILRKQADNSHRVNRSRICEVCGKTFEYKHKCQKTCSPKCGRVLTAQAFRSRPPQKKLDRVISKCELCGKEIEHLPSQHPRFCSQECVHKYMAKINTKTERISPKEIRTCVVCGKEFEVTKTAAKRWCSPECRQKLHMRICPICGKNFYSPNRSQVCCSRKCDGQRKSRAWANKKSH